MNPTNANVCVLYSYISCRNACRFRCFLCTICVKRCVVYPCKTRVHSYHSFIRLAPWPPNAHRLLSWRSSSMFRFQPCRGPLTGTAPSAKPLRNACARWPASSATSPITWRRVCATDAAKCWGLLCRISTATFFRRSLRASKRRPARRVTTSSSASRTRKWRTSAKTWKRS